jgi:hypothetical protein
MAMSYYQIQQKEQTAKENIVFNFSKILSWFLRQIAMIIGVFIKAFIDAIKLLFHT